MQRLEMPQVNFCARVFRIIDECDAYNSRRDLLERLQHLLRPLSFVSLSSIFSFFIFSFFHFVGDLFCWLCCPDFSMAMFDRDLFLAFFGF